jgi:hypothetical protein
VTYAGRIKLDQAQAVDATGANARPLKLDTASIRLDGSWAPYVQATFTGPPPSDADLTAIDPRAGWRLQCRAYTLDAAGVPGPYWNLDLNIRSRTRSYSSTPSAQFTAASDESKLQDYAFGTLQDGTGDSRQRGATDWALVPINYLGLQLQIIPGAPDGPMNGADVGWTPDANVWDHVVGLAESVGARVYCDAPGTVIWAAPSYNPGSDHLPAERDHQRRRRREPRCARLGEFRGRDLHRQLAGAVRHERRRQEPAQGDRSHAAAAAAGHRQRGDQDPHHGAGPRQKPDDQRYRRPDRAAMQSRRASYQGQTWTGTVQSVEFNLPAGTMSVVLNVIE